MQVFNWSPHDTGQPAGFNCTELAKPGELKSLCILSSWPLIAGAGAPGSTDVNGGVPQAANLTKHIELIRRTMPYAFHPSYDGVSARCFL